MTSENLVYLIALPLFSSALLMLLGRKADKWGHIFATLISASTFVIGAMEFFAMIDRPEASRAVTQKLFTWISVGTFNVDAGLLLDQLSIAFVLLITGVGTLIHVYSIAYMSHDKDRRRFFAYLNFFIAAMLLLVLGDSYLNLYVGWEGVGLASYLLIGFWNQKPEYATAAKKAFVANRVGDFGLSVAVMIAFANFGAVSFIGIEEKVGGASETALTAMGLMLLLAAVGKSAQFPLQAWLGDAMAGPTPVSALIHAATMVTAGVYLITRSNFIFDNAPTAQLAVVIVGTITLLFGAIIGMAKDDIKKALAASTMSQIGYMIMASGFGPAGYAFAIMHLLTHGFFKAGMFLGAGSVMHGMNDEVNMRRYGGLAKFMPITSITFGLGYLAIIGVPPFAGFYSKDKIIETAFNAGGLQGVLFGSAALLGAVITAFYMTRLMLMTFFGNKRWAQGSEPHESPFLMWAPMAVLAVGSVASGYLLYSGKAIVKWLAPVVDKNQHEHTEFLPPIVVTTLAVVAVIIGVSIAFIKYRGDLSESAPSEVSIFTRVIRRDLLQDDANEFLFMRPGQKLTQLLVKTDESVIDGAVRAVGSSALGSARGMRKLQTGYVRNYALLILIGALVALLAALAVTI
ncbi:MAG: NADH-quinone oxidoreductase subunit L [Candidatus Nanopelagicales bacterium]|jgi:NADH-quinone oxidoreductase subunit L|uniref:NADH-quinone oxidoreductase subunit L n=2 Tax=ac1 cluster TaxID=1655545 RepID=A0A0R2NYZ2_9ACTN|nr:MAG: NADH-quinone oxidoreductase subunit L [Actinobacteria bacterium BACL2 MAG-120802-bin41]KRO45050.1 MAG: NADH-quinone oxidoreductase subunit L [Actinobacteria bacterium BACL2 MAG-120813-bin23]MDP4615201.1 NADH-quinone oxidoreductase subunit L [Candidatus Nanopelagicales bacterium]MDP4865000.1 NADH-quinone oxidoreductase subunit L [Candidatus Nanopelagicaceae bacterium]MDP4652562.1 NADH-quinone oxidoreductase subunit L [Candidatus Nanopelagicales bacterium]